MYGAVGHAGSMTDTRTAARSFFRRINRTLDEIAFVAYSVSIS